MDKIVNKNLIHRIGLNRNNAIQFLQLLNSYSNLVQESEEFEEESKVSDNESDNESEITNDTMIPGIYYIGDLSHVMTQEELNEYWDPEYETDKIYEGNLILSDGRRFSAFTIVDKEYSYADQFDKKYSAEISGLLGCILLSHIRKPNAQIELGNVFEMDEPFETSNNNGIIKIGFVEIDTTNKLSADY